MGRLCTLNMAIGNLVNTEASDAKASTNHLESCLDVIQGQTFWDHWKPDKGLHITV